MPCSISKKSARHLSFLLPVMLAAGCSQNAHKDDTLNQSSSKFSVFTHSGTANGKLRLANRGGHAQQAALGEHTTVWDRMQALYALPDIDNARIDREIGWYLKNPDYLSRIQQRAEPYLHFILNEIESKNLPGELALLPIIESAFKPDAQSPAQASGLWQFIPPTGRLYGLKQNTWYDGRRDIVESTQAATTFLKELNSNFHHDWLLALASYNAGPGNIKNAMDRNTDRGMPTDYWSLDLNSETAAYVPKLLAIAKIFGNPEKYNLNLQPIPDRPYFEQVDVKSHLDLHKAAEMAETPAEDFFKLNPGFNRKVTHPEGSHRLLIPVHKASTFKEKLAELPHNERVKWEHHTVAANETVDSIAHLHRTTSEEILAINHLESGEVTEGKILLIPGAYPEVVASSDEPRHQEHASNSQHVVASVKSVSYTVKKGDTLKSLANQFDVDKDDIVSWNKLPSKALLKPGQKLTLKKAGSVTASSTPSSSSPTSKKAATNSTYTIKPGDTLGEISKKFNVSVVELRRLNNVPKNKADLKPGSKLKING